MQPWFRRIALGCAVFAAIVVPEQAFAQQALTNGVWQVFTFFTDDVTFPSPVDGNGFSFSAGVDQQVRLSITDLGVSGDRFELFANNVSGGLTPVVSPDIDTGILDAEDAFNSSALSSAEFFFGTGDYVFTLELVSSAAGFFFGEGAIRAELIQGDPFPPPPPPPNSVPEPATLWLMPTGLLALALTLRYRQSQHS